MRVMFVAALTVITISLARAEWIDFGTGVSEAKTTILEQSSSHTTFEVKVPGLDVTPTWVSGREFVRLHIPGAGAAGLEVGKPELPVIPLLLARKSGTLYYFRLL
jgi:hypothetical protein